MQRKQRIARVVVPVVVVVTGLLGAVVLVGSSSAATSIRGFEAETMTSDDGHGTVVRDSRDASGGRHLKVYDNVSVTARVTLPQPTTTVQVRARTDRGVRPGASTRVIVDGQALGSVWVNPSRWTWYSFTRPLVAGPHELTVQFLNAEARNLYLDVFQFSGGGSGPPPESGTGSPTGPSATPPPSPSTATSTAPSTVVTSRAPPVPTSTPTTARAPAPPRGTETVVPAYVTGYSWFDNTPPGSSDIAYPGLHSKAGGTGTYGDPITVAVGHTITNGTSRPDWPAGTRFYIPNLRRYFIVEDACGDGSTPQNGPCHTGYPGPATTWLDVWVGGEGGTNSGADACMSAFTAVWTAITDPASNYAVVSGDIYGPPCTTQYGNAAVRA